MKNDIVTVEKTYDAPMDKVWAALTVPALMKQWYFDVPDFRPEVGCEFSFMAGDGEKKWLHLCRVTEVVKGSKISYSWRYDGLEGESFVTFALSADGGSTHLNITHIGLSTFSFGSESFLKGWTYFATKALPEFLAKN